MSALPQADVPEDVLAALQAAGYTWQKLSDEALKHFAGVLFARKVLTLEQAARLSGTSLWDFIPFLSEQGIPVADYDADEIQREIESAHILAGSREANRGTSG
jgi:predicted HTH domain antitoxin